VVSGVASTTEPSAAAASLMNIMLACRPSAVCRWRRAPPLIHSTDSVAVLPRSLTETRVHLPTLADFGIFGAWDGRC
jgi:hypothetical protein